MVRFEQDLFQRVFETGFENLIAVTTDASGQLDVFGHDRDAFCMQCAQIGILK